MQGALSDLSTDGLLDTNNVAHRRHLEAVPGSLPELERDVIVQFDEVHTKEELVYVRGQMTGIALNAADGKTLAKQVQAFLAGSLYGALCNSGI